jgi:pilus assembly protein Flp/PilA
VKVEVIPSTNAATELSPECYERGLSQYLAACNWFEASSFGTPPAKLGQRRAPSFLTIARKSEDNCSKIESFILRSTSELVRKFPDAPGTNGAAQSGRSKQMSIVTRFLRAETGATAIEYGLIAAGIAAAIIATVAGLGTKLEETFTTVDGALN